MRRTLTLTIEDGVDLKGTDRKGRDLRVEGALNAYLSQSFIYVADHLGITVEWEWRSE